MNEAEIEAHNRNELWKDVINHLTIATECLDQAISAMEDVHSDPELIKATTKIESLLNELIADAEDEKGGAA